MAPGKQRPPGKKEVSKHLTQIGFKKGDFNPCLFNHTGRKIRLMVHGDDYAAAGPRSQLIWLKQELETRFGKEYVKTDLLSSHANDSREISILNRILRLTGEGIEMEADVRHAEILVKELVHVSLTV